MTFAERYISFDAKISDISRSLEARFFTKTPLHPDTTLFELFIRVLAHVIRYEPDLTLSVGEFEPDLPSSYKKDLYGKFETIILLNEDRTERIDKLLRHNKESKVYLFFTDATAKEGYLHSIKGSFPDYYKRMECIDLKISESLYESIQDQVTRFKFDAVISDEVLYLTLDQQSIEVEFEVIDLKAEYQKYLLSGRI